MYIHSKPQQLSERKKATTSPQPQECCVFFETTSCLLQVKGIREESAITLLWGYEMWKEATYPCAHTCRGKLLTKPYSFYNLESLVAA